MTTGWRDHERGSLAAAWRNSVVAVEATGEDCVRVTMNLPAILQGPPMRLHGGFHPLVRVLPLLAALRPEAPEGQVRMELALRRSIRLGEDVHFDAQITGSGAGYVLETRQGEDDRLLARVTPVEPGSLSSPDLLADLAKRFEQARDGAHSTIRVVGCEYLTNDDVICFDPAADGALTEDAHMHGTLLPDGRAGITTLSTQLDAVAATGASHQHRHPHFTTRFECAFDIESEGVQDPIFIADRRGIRLLPESGLRPVEVGGIDVGSARIEAWAVDRDFQRVLGWARLDVHPVDPARFEGFSRMRELRG